MSTNNITTDGGPSAFTFILVNNLERKLCIADFTINNFQIIASVYFIAVMLMAAVNVRLKERNKNNRAEIRRVKETEESSVLVQDQNGSYLRSISYDDNFL